MTRKTLNALGMVLAVLAVIATSARVASVSAHSFFQQDKTRQAAALVDEGVAALEKGDEAAARGLFKRALEADPNNELANTYMGVLSDRAGQLNEAERYFAAAAIAAPTSPAARNNHGAILLRLGRTEQAARQFEISLKLDPKQPGALVNLAQIRFQSGKPEDLKTARSLFERAWALEPDAEIAHSLLVIALRTNDRASATAYFKEYARLIPTASEKLTSPSARAQLAVALNEAGLTDEAREEMTAVLAADPNNVKAILLLAQSYLASKDIAAAGRTLESAVARGIEDASIYAALAEVYQQYGRPENAIPAMRLATERDPKNELYRFRYAMLLIDTKAPAAAVIRLREALADFPSSAKLQFALGIALFRDNKQDEAAKAFERAVTLDPKFAPALAYLGMIYDETGRYSDALSLYERAIAADDRLAAARYLAADALLRQSTPDLVKAEAHLRRAIALDPSFPLARLALAKLCLRTDRLTEAATLLEKLVAEDPTLAEAQYQLGRAYMRLKRTEEAQKVLATFKQLNEDQKQREQSERQELVRRLANVRF